MSHTEGHVLALAGGVGGAKLVAGLDHCLHASGRDDALSVVVNTGDDFEHLGLYIAPDLDSVTYALAGLNDSDRGWGMRNESWQFMQALERLGGETWFSLGDQDLATHTERTRLLNAGETLSGATRHITRALGIKAHVAPMSDDPVRTLVNTDAGQLAFQHYFVREQCAPRVISFDFAGSASAEASVLLQTALARTDLKAVVICPSNPFISIDPMLAIDGVADALRAVRVPVVAVSPIVGGNAIKGPAAKMLEELGRDVSALGIAAHYGNLIDGFVIDELDEALAAQLAPLPVLVTNTMMTTDQHRTELANKVLNWSQTLY